MTARAPRPVVIALDAMSGDRGPEDLGLAACEGLVRHSDLQIILTGPRDRLAGCVAGFPEVASRLAIEHASEVVEMGESPRDALRKKRDSSMRRALELVRDGRADACVSAGNTGALVASARYVLKTIPGIDRPAFVSVIPARGGHTCMLDLGANTDCSATHLYQFAIMGSVIAEDLFELEAPRIGLLNIGEESNKGTAVIKEAAALLAASRLNFIGYVEGHDIFTGRADVIVSDGFIGNVALKTIEGAYAEVLHVVREELTDASAGASHAPDGASILGSLSARLDPRRYNGASLVGVRGIVIKSHGNADTMALGNALDLAVLESQKGVLGKINDRVAELLPESERS